MAPKRNPPRGQRATQPNDKGKQPEGPQGQQGMEGQAEPSAGASGSGHRNLAPKKKKKKKRRESDATEEWASDDPLLVDMGGPNPHQPLVSHFLSLPRATITVPVGASATPGEAGPSAMDVSPRVSPQPHESILPRVQPRLQLPARDDASSSTSSRPQPPSRDKYSSNASSRGSKRRREASPQPQRDHRHPTLRPRGETSPRHATTGTMLEQQVTMLQQQVWHHQEEVNSLRRQISQEYDVGYTHGRAKGFEEAMAMAIQVPPHRREAHECHDHRDADKPKAEEPRKVDHRSWRDSQPAQLAQTPGASRSAPRQAAQPPPR